MCKSHKYALQTYFWSTCKDHLLDNENCDCLQVSELKKTHKVFASWEAECTWSTGNYPIYNITTCIITLIYKTASNSHLLVSCLFQEPLDHECPKMTTNKLEKYEVSLDSYDTCNKQRFDTSMVYHFIPYTGTVNPLLSPLGAYLFQACLRSGWGEGGTEWRWGLIYVDRRP